MRRNKATPEQIAKAKEKRAKMREIARKISAMSDEERSALVHDWPTLITGHPVSFHNACMIAYQGGATVLGGFWQWKSAGRKVRKGESGMCIWAPIGDKKSANVEEIEETDANGQKSKRRFDCWSCGHIDNAETEERRAA